MKTQPPTITSRQHPLCKLVRSLHSSKGRKQHKLFVVEGGNGVEAALRARWPLQRVIVPQSELGGSWRELAQSSGIETQTVSEELMEYLCDAETSTDVIALAEMPKSQEFISQPSSFILVLDDSFSMCGRRNTYNRNAGQRRSLRTKSGARFGGRNFLFAAAGEYS
jgi:TrmH family RNA methyltransferase